MKTKPTDDPKTWPEWYRREIEVGVVVKDISPDKFRRALHELGLWDKDGSAYGWGWFAGIMGVTPATVEKWTFGYAKIPQHAIAYVLLARELKGMTPYCVGIEG